MAKSVGQSTAYNSRKIEPHPIHVIERVYKDGVGFVDEVKAPSLEPPAKVQDSVDLLRSRKRGGLTEAQFFAAQTYHEAYEAQYSSLGGSLDFERVRSPRNTAPLGPASRIAYGANKMIEAGEIFVAEFGKEAALVAAVVDRIAGLGFNLEQCTRQICKTPEGKRPSGREVKRIGEIFRSGLDALSSRWHGRPVDFDRLVRKQPERFTDGPKPTAVDSEIKIGEVSAAHFHAGKWETPEEVRARISRKKKRSRRGKEA